MSVEEVNSEANFQVMLSFERCIIYPYQSRGFSETFFLFSVDELHLNCISVKYFESNNSRLMLDLSVSVKIISI